MNIIDSNNQYILFETFFPGQYDIYKCNLGDKSVYMMMYTLKAQNFSDTKKQYWIDVLKKSKFINVN